MRRLRGRRNSTHLRSSPLLSSESPHPDPHMHSSTSMSHPRVYVPAPVPDVPLFDDAIGHSHLVLSVPSFISSSSSHLHLHLDRFVFSSSNPSIRTRLCYAIYIRIQNDDPFKQGKVLDKPSDGFTSYLIRTEGVKFVCRTTVDGWWATPNTSSRNR